MVEKDPVLRGIFRSMKLCLSRSEDPRYRKAYDLLVDAIEERVLYLSRSWHRRVSKPRPTAATAPSPTPQSSPTAAPRTVEP